MGKRRDRSGARSLPKAQGVSLLPTAPSRRLLVSQFHPNIYPDGTLCLDLIQDNWSPIYSVRLHVTPVVTRLAARPCSVLGRSCLCMPLHAAAAKFPSCSEARPLPPALPPYRTESTHARTHARTAAVATTHPSASRPPHPTRFRPYR